jgi:hypothetical protein
MHMDVVSQLQQQIGSAHSKIQSVAQKMQQIEGGNLILQQQIQLLNKSVTDLQSVMSSVQVSGGSGRDAGIGVAPWKDQVMFINDIPGRRVPMDVLVTIPITNNSVAAAEQSTPISQNGPFVAVRRFIAFYSMLTASVASQGVTATFQGRSYGRQRPTNSILDLFDAQAMQPIVGVAAPGTGAPIYGSPSNTSGFRTMEFDGVVEFMNEGYGQNFQTMPVPASLYTDGFNSAFDLASLAFFERGEVLNWKVTPSHINNPSAGNVALFKPGLVFPTLASQYDVHEGILDEFDAQATADPATRVPTGVIVIGFHGFKILQPPGPVRMI